MCDSLFSVGAPTWGRPLRNMYDVPTSLLEEPSKSRTGRPRATPTKSVLLVVSS